MPLADIIRGKTLAIVGNGPTELGAGHGPEIDAADLVVRFKEYKLGGFQADYGTRTDLWVTNCGRRNKRRGGKYMVMCCPLPLLSVRYRGEYGQRRYWAPVLSGRIELMPVPWYDELAKLNPAPSLGAGFVWWVYMLRGVFPRAWLYGFTGEDRGQALHYFDNRTWATFPKCNHRMEWEWAVINHCTREDA